MQTEFRIWNSNPFLPPFELKRNIFGTKKSDTNNFSFAHPGGSLGRNTRRRATFCPGLCHVTGLLLRERKSQAVGQAVNLQQKFVEQIRNFIQVVMLKQRKPRR